MASSIPHDQEGHRQWRRMITKWFTAKRMATMRPEIEAMAEQLVDEMVAQGPPADLREHLGFGLPRYLTEEVEVSDGVLPEGSPVLCDMGAGNRDLPVRW